MTIRFRTRLCYPAVFCAALGALAAGALRAGDIGGPVSGYLFDADARTVRPVLGIPGAATVGQPLDFGFDLKLAAVAPSQDYLVAAGSAGRVRLVRLGGTAAAQDFDALHGAPGRIVFSPRGSAALLVNDGTADVYAGLPGAPALARTLRLPATPSALAVSDDAGLVFGVFDGVLSLAGASAEWTPLPGVGEVSLAAFAPSSRNAALVARDGAVVLYRDDSGDTAVLTAPDAGVPSAVGVLFDGSRVLVASASARTVTLLDVASASRADLPCGCSPTGLTAMGPMYRLNDLAGAPIWLLDSRPAEPQFLFVPALGDARGSLTQESAR